MPVTGQLAIFSADSAQPTPYDLAGLLIGPGQVTRMGGTARVSIVVDAAWRVHVLAAEFALRGLETSWEAAVVEGHFGVRTAYTGVLAPLAQAWLHGAVKRPPATFALDGARLRLWFAATGVLDDDQAGITLRLGEEDESVTATALRVVRAVAGSADVGRGPVIRVSGRRRVARLGELMGRRPAAAPESSWPAPLVPRARPG